ncbi:hypothetical protein ANANG_G00268660 [Anguilla anguilla]|uniref:G-protein coupled receptors family 1 profile domain-containing protein n=1 Tax=Anguilla anguilla TaxID=7936 RepID=A0A9D3RLY9_ANGAN|nr:hypothetical protein ANANG_G00268660 [Anguilla anguilla]
MQSLFYNSTLSNSTVIFENGKSVLWIQLVMAVLSIVGSGSIIVFALFQNLLGTCEVRALFFLSLADLLVCFTWLIGAVLLNQTCDNRTACYNLHAVEQEDCCRDVTGQSTVFPGRTSSLTKMALVLSGVLPVLLMVPVFIVGNSNSCSRSLSQAYECLLMHTWVLYSPSRARLEATPCHHVHAYSIVIFVSTFAVSLSGILVLMAKARSVYARCVESTDGLLDARGWAGLGVRRRQMKLYPAAFAVCWFPAVLLAVLILFNLQEAPLLYVILYLLQAFTSPSQGWLNCLLYGWTQQRLRTLTALEKRDVDTQTPSCARRSRRATRRRRSEALGRMQAGKEHRVPVGTVGPQQERGCAGG